LLPGSTTVAYDLSHTIEPSSWYGTLPAATINVTPTATVLEVVIWLAYAGLVLFLFFRPAPKRVPVTA
jgi:high-affinity iron transporter